MSEEKLVWTLGSENFHKLVEIAALLLGAPVELRPLPEGAKLPPETGKTLMANAQIKARAAATLSGEIAGAGGDITGGSLSKKKGGAGFGKRSKSELESISAQLQEKMAESDSVTIALNEAREKVAQLETEIRKITTEQADAQGRKRRRASSGPFR